MRLKILLGLLSWKDASLLIVDMPTCNILAISDWLWPWLLNSNTFALRHSIISSFLLLLLLLFFIPVWLPIFELRFPISYAQFSRASHFHAWHTLRLPIINEKLVSF